MTTWLRRLFWIAVASGAGFAVYSLVQQRRAPGAAPTPASPAPASPEPAVPEPAVPEPAPPAPWVAPADGACPDGYPIKVSTNSGIYHSPGGRFYDRTAADRCYVDAQAAEADGYRQAKA